MGRYLLRSILLDRERKRLDDLAVERGLENADIMFYEMYVVKEIPIQKIAELLFTPIYTLRKRFDEIGIAVKTRGGRHPETVLVEPTATLAHEVSVDGATLVSKKLGVTRIAVLYALSKWVKHEREENLRED